MAETPLHPVAHAPVEHVAHGGQGIGGWWHSLPTGGKFLIIGVVAVVGYFVFRSFKNNQGSNAPTLTADQAAPAGVPSSSTPSSGAGAGGAGSGDGGSGSGSSSPQGSSYPVPVSNTSTTTTYNLTDASTETTNNTTNNSTTTNTSTTNNYATTGRAGTSHPIPVQGPSLGKVQQQTLALVTQAEVAGTARPGIHPPPAGAIFSVPVFTAEGGYQTISIMGKTPPRTSGRTSTNTSTHPAGAAKKPPPAHHPVHVAPKKPQHPAGWRG